MQSSPQRFFELIYEHSLDGILHTRVDGTVLRANPSACRMLGRTEAEIQRLGRAGLIDEDQRLAELLRQRLTGQPIAGTMWFKLPGGGRLEVEFTSGLLPTAADGPSEAYVIFRDRTLVRQTEEGLRRANRALTLVTRCNEALVRATDEQGLFTAVCEAVVRHGGYRMCWVGLALDDAQRRVKPVASAGLDDGYLAQAEITWADEPRGRGPTGTALREGRVVVGSDFSANPTLSPWRKEAIARGFVSSTALPLVHQGQRLGVLTMYSGEKETFDPPELELLSRLSADLAFGVQALRRRAAIEAAEADRARLLAAIDQAAEGVIITDPHGGVLYVNPAFERLHEQTPGSLVGTNHRFLEKDVVNRAELAPVIEGMRAGRTAQARVQRRAPGGALRVEDLVISPVRNAAGHVTSFVGVVRDVTADLEREAQFLQSQKMESIGRLAGGIAHDFNNLLSVILTVTDMVLERLQPGDPLRKDLNEIDTAGRRAATLTRQLLTFSRKQVVNPELVDVNQVLGNMDRMLRRLLGEDVALDLRLAPALGPVRVDPGQLEQVVMNLAVNARDAMPRGGTLTLETSVATVGEGAEARDVVRLRVRDTGSGMDEAVQARAFEPFFTTKEFGKGTGLGLSTAYGIVRQAGGTIAVTSERGAGSTFTVELPRHAEPTPTAAAPVATPATTEGSETVLLVEDDAPVRAVAQRVLADHGYAVLAAANAGEALLLWEQQRPRIDVLVTDVVMPLLNGPQLAERLRRDAPGLKVLFTSGHPEIPDGAAPPFLDAARFLPKPFHPADLLRSLRETLDG